MKKQKLALKKLKVKSFTTSEVKDIVGGGSAGCDIGSVRCKDEPQM